MRHLRWLLALVLILAIAVGLGYVVGYQHAKTRYTSIGEPVFAQATAGQPVAGLGENWRAVRGQFVAQAGRVESISDTDADLLLVASRLLDPTIDVTLSGQHGVENCRAWQLVFRYIDAGNYLTVYLHDQKLYLQKHVRGGHAILAWADAPWQDGVPYRLRVQVYGPFIKAFINGKLLIEYALSAQEAYAFSRAAQRMGLMLRKIGHPTLPAWWSDFSASPSAPVKGAWQVSWR